MSFIKPFSRNKKKAEVPEEDESRLLGYGSMDNDEEESYYEEVIVDDDGEEYIEEILDDGIPPPQQAASDDLRVTKEQVDNMDIQSAKQYLMALPSAKGPTIIAAPVRYSDDDYEYEEIVIEEESTVTPLPKSRRFSHFENRVLDAIVEESDHTVGSPKSPPASRKKSMERRADPNEESKSQRDPLPVLQEVTSPNATPQDESDHEEQENLPEMETTLDGELKDAANKRQVEGNQRVVVATSHTSLQSSCSTATTVPDSERSLDLEEVFNLSTPLLVVSPDQRVAPSSASSQSSRRSSRGENGESPSHQNRDALGTHFTGDASNNSHGRIRHTSSDDRSLGSTRTSESRRRRDSGGSRRSSRSSKTGGEDRGKSIEAEIREFLSSSFREERRSIDTMLSSPERTGDRQRDADDRSRVSQRSKSQDRGDRSSQYGERERRASKRPSKVIASESSSSTESSKKDSNVKPKGALVAGSDTLDAFLSRIPDGPTKRSDARSTVSGSLRSSRRRHGDDRDTQSLAPNESSRRPLRARSARRTKSSQSDLIVPSSKEAPPRSRSSSVGRKERLRRSRQNQMMEKTDPMTRDGKPPTGSRSSRDSSTSSRRMSRTIDQAVSRRTSSPSPRKSSSSIRSASPSREINSSRRSTSPSSSLESLRKAASPSPRNASTSMRSASPVSSTEYPSPQREVISSPRKSSSQTHSSANGVHRHSASNPSLQTESRRFTDSSAVDRRGKEHIGRSHSSQQDITRVSVQRSRSGKSRNDGDRSSFLGRSYSESLNDVSSAKKNALQGSPSGRSPRETSNVHTPKPTKEMFTLTSPKPQDRENHTSFNRTLELARNLREDGTDGVESDPKLLSPRKDPVGRSASGTKSGSDLSKKVPTVENSTPSPRTPTGDERRGSVQRSRSGGLRSAESGDPTTSHSRRGRRVPDRSESRERHHSSRSKRSSSESVSASPAGSFSNHSKPPIQTSRTPDPTSSQRRQTSPPNMMTTPMAFHHSLPEMDLPPSMVSLAGHSSDVESYLSTMSSLSTGNVTNESHSGHLHLTSSRRGHHSIPSLCPTPSSSMDSHTTIATPFERLRQLEKIKAFLTEDEYQQKKKEILASI
jgi:hypothetical protein